MVSMPCWSLGYGVAELTSSPSLQTTLVAPGFSLAELAYHHFLLQPVVTRKTHSSLPPSSLPPPLPDIYDSVEDKDAVPDE
jgi:hypothetical protein